MGGSGKAPAAAAEPASTPQPKGLETPVAGLERQMRREREQQQRLAAAALGDDKAARDALGDSSNASTGTAKIG